MIQFVRFSNGTSTYFSIPRCRGAFALLFVLSFASSGWTWFDSYKRYSEINTRMDGWATSYADLVTPLNIGNSYEGRAIRGVRIGTGEPNRPTVVINGVLHAREWIAAMVPVYIGETILDGYGIDPQITALVDQVDIVVLPVINPDGYEFSWNTNRNWRKNRRPVEFFQFGVDLNRNWDFGWGLDSGSSGLSFLDTYRGPAPFSEPETQALRDFFLSNQNIVSYIDTHSYGQLILYPYGYTDQVAPPDQDLLITVGDEMAASIHAVHNETYIVQTSSDLYFSSGTAIDWAYGDQGVYSYVVELRPQTSNPGFLLPPDQIVPTSEEMFAAFLDFARFTATVANGDFDYDGAYDCGDMEALVDAIVNGSNKAQFDLNRDGVVDTTDIPSWLVRAGEATFGSGLAFLPGDANLDGTVDGTDFFVWNQHKFSESVSWCSGDFNGDGVVDGLDFILWNDHKFTSVNRPVPIPEPAAGWLLMLGACLMWRRR